MGKYYSNIYEFDSNCDFDFLCEENNINNYINESS